ncbi:MAG: hypothetical protein ATN31_10295 [Candidatus Epulonipiscioides saccharophilum]|nr:MAG: hypothetical protein ATN31_10295 [Epulopiscium sp. AS2M-Bin001]
MSKTNLTIEQQKFLINGTLVYSEYPNVKPTMLGTLMNARFIQAIFDTQDRGRFNRYGKTFDPDVNTEELIEALPEWYASGLRAITVGLQGGGNCFTVPGHLLQNNPYSADGTTVCPKYLDRLLKLIKACDDLGIIVIVSYFYAANISELEGAQAVINIVEGMTKFLANSGFNNLIIEIANEFNIAPFAKMPLIHEPQGMVALINFAKLHANGIPIGCSGGGGFTNEEVCKASDVVIIHGNGESRSRLYNHIHLVRKYTPNKPILINEDSQAIGQLTVCEQEGVSWGYYNNMTKQEVPTYWGITRGEDEFFAARMAQTIGIMDPEIPEEDQLYFQGLEDHMHSNGTRFPRVASLYPEKINYVKFYENGELVYICYDESFTFNFRCNWQQDGVLTKDGDVWRADVYLRDGEVRSFYHTIKNS